MSYIIGSFNLRDFNFANKSSDGDNETINRDFKKIAQIIIEEKMDVVALQEVNSEFALKYLTQILNASKTPFREFESIFGTSMPTKTRDPERYGFIWNAKRLCLLKTKRNNNPSYYKNAGAIGNSDTTQKQGLIRPPYYARFTARGKLGGSNFELRLINTHILGSGSEKDRIREFDILVKRILPRICDHQEISFNGNVMPAYTFLLGDYNLELNKSERSIHKIETITETNYTGKKRSYITTQDKATTLRKPNQQQTVEDCYANNYDHFTYEIDLPQKLKLIPQRVEVLSKYFPEVSGVVDKLGAYRMKVSDHVPIKLIVDLK